MNVQTIVDPRSRALIFDSLLESLCADGQITAREADAAVGAAAVLELGESPMDTPPWESGFGRGVEHAELERSLAVASAAWGALIDDSADAYAQATVERIAANMGVGSTRMKALVNVARKVRAAASGRLPFQSEFELLLIAAARCISRHQGPTDECAARSSR